MKVGKLLVALDDEKVKEKILQLLDEKISQNTTLPIDPQVGNGSDQITELQHENKKLKSLVEKFKGLFDSSEKSKKQIIASLEYQLEGKSKEISKLEKDSDSVKKEIELSNRENTKNLDKLMYYRDNFSGDLRIKEIYDSFSGQTKLSLSGIFKDDSVKGLVACGIQEKNISNLWDYAKNEVVSGSNQDQEAITQLFELLFERFNLAYPMFELQRPSCGDTFDTQQYIKHNSSTNTSGSIQEVLLAGYVNNKNNKVIKSAIVVI